MPKKRELTPKDLLGDRWPNDRHPETGEPFEQCQKVEMDQELIEFMTTPPERPSWEVYEWNEETEMPVKVGTLTEKEYREAMKKYEKALDRWHANQGRERVAGQQTVTARFATKSGAWAEGTFLGRERDPNWAWTRWGGPDQCFP